MKLSEFLGLVSKPGRLNYMALCPDQLGLISLLGKALNRVSSPEDQVFFNARDITKEKARQIEGEARMAPRGGSKLQHFFIYGLQRLPTDSVGPLLKAVEEAKYTRFIFQAQDTPRKIRTLMSRSSVVSIPFITKQVVFANLKAEKLDARTADEMGLYDGTYDGTRESLGMKDSLTRIRRDCRAGVRGIASLYQKDVLDSRAFEKATLELFTPEELEYLNRNPSSERKKIILWTALRRVAS